MRNCTAPKVMPAMRIAVREPLIPRRPDMAYTVAKAVTNDNGAIKRPVIWESFIQSSCVMRAKVSKGMAREQKETGPVLATTNQGRHHGLVP